MSLLSDLSMIAGSVLSMYLSLFVKSGPGKNKSLRQLKTNSEFYRIFFLVSCSRKQREPLMGYLFNLYVYIKIIKSYVH